MLDAIHQWVILIKRENGQPIGGVYFTEVKSGWCEIFGVDLADGIKNSNNTSDLMEAAIYEAKQMNANYLTFLCDAISLKYHNKLVLSVLTTIYV